MSGPQIAARLLAGVWMIAVAVAPAASAESYPSRNITLIVPYPAGGGADLIGRLVGQKLSTALGRPVVIANRGGAGGMIGTRELSRAAPDGYTLGIMLTGASLSPAADYDMNKDFTPIGIIASTPVIIVAHPSFSPKTLADVIALAKKEPGKLTIGTPPPPILNYFAIKMFNLKADVDTNIVTYKGTAPLTTDLLGNQIPLAFNTVSGVVAYVQAGQLRGIAVAGERRSASLPEVPTAAESGMPDFDAVMYYGLAALAGLPRPLVDRLNEELRAMLSDDQFRMKVVTGGNDPSPSTPEEYASNIRREEGKWANLITRLGIKND